jgi:hypothetical protein
LGQCQARRDLARGEARLTMAPRAHA